MVETFYDIYTVPSSPRFLVQPLKKTALLHHPPRMTDSFSNEVITYRFQLMCPFGALFRSDYGPFRFFSRSSFCTCSPWFLTIFMPRTGVSVLAVFVDSCISLTPPGQ